MSVTLYIREECRYEVAAETAVEAARLFMATPNKFLTSVDERDWDPSEDVDYDAVEAVFMGEDVDRDIGSADGDRATLRRGRMPLGR